MKPITVAREDFIQSIINDINQSDLPAFVVADVLTDILATVNQLKEQQYQSDLKAYQAEEEEQPEEN